MAIGSADLAKFMVGKRLTIRRAVLAKCNECCGGYRDKESRQDCEVETCPLRPWMPYRHDNLRKTAQKAAITTPGGTGAPGDNDRARMAEVRQAKKHKVPVQKEGV